MKTVYTAQAPEAIGPYSQAIISGNLVFTSGQIAINPQTGKVEKTDIEGQTVQVLENLKAVLEAAGCSLEKVVKTTCFLADMKDFARFNRDIQAVISPASLQEAVWRQRNCPKEFWWRSKPSERCNFFPISPFFRKLVLFSEKILDNL